MGRNIWLLPYSNFEGDDYNPSKGLAVRVKHALLAKDKGYICRIKRVGVNIYDADEAIDEIEFLDQSKSPLIDVVVAFGLGNPEGLFNFEHTGTAERNNIPGKQYDLFGRFVEKNLQEYDDINLEGKVAKWYYDKKIYELVRKCEARAGQKRESPGADNYLCGYMTQKLAASLTLTNKSFFIHTQDYSPTKESEQRNEAGRYIADFIDAFCDLKSQ